MATVVKYLAIVFPNFDNLQSTGSPSCHYYTGFTVTGIEGLTATYGAAFG